MVILPVASGHKVSPWLCQYTYSTPYIMADEVSNIAVPPTPPKRIKSWISARLTEGYSGLSTHSPVSMSLTKMFPLGRYGYAPQAPL